MTSQFYASAGLVERSVDDQNSSYRRTLKSRSYGMNLNGPGFVSLHKKKGFTSFPLGQVITLKFFTVFKYIFFLKDV